MVDDLQPSPTPPSPPRRGRLWWIPVAAVALYFLISFIILPAIWKRHESRHPALADAATVTHTSVGIPGDPLNVGLIGTEEQIHRGMLSSGWYAADAITLASSLRIAADVVFKRPFDEAPVSPLYLYGRKEDLAFEKPVGDNPRERHHVRFWRSDKLDAQQRPIWFGSATFDKHVGFSRDSGQFTHVISPNVDNDRDLIISDLQKSGAISAIDWIDRFHKVLEGKNGEGDPWQTDGRLAIGVLVIVSPSTSPSPQTQP